VFVIAAVRSPRAPAAHNSLLHTAHAPPQVSSILGLFVVALAIIYIRRSRSNAAMVMIVMVVPVVVLCTSACVLISHTLQTLELSSAAAAGHKQKHM
jgi:ABC-type transport system involved in multi-copper enzyme maturation permease subunit